MTQILHVDLDAARPEDAARLRSRSGPRQTPTTVTPWNGTDSTDFNVALATPAQGAPRGSCVVAMSHDYRLDALMLRRLEILADVTHHLVVGVDTPGVTMNFSNPQQTPRPKVAAPLMLGALRGDYSRVAALQTAAIESVTGIRVSDSRIVGESLGAQLGSSLAALAGQVRSIDLIEPVNCRPLTITALLRLQRALAGVERTRKDLYVRHNTRMSWGAAVPFELTSADHAAVDRRLKSFPQQGRYVLAISAGLRRSLERTLSQVDPSVPVGVWYADASLVSEPRDIEWMASNLAARGTVVDRIRMTAPETWPTGIGHHALSDLDLMSAFARNALKRWDGVPAEHSS